MSRHEIRVDRPYCRNLATTFREGWRRAVPHHHCRRTRRRGMRPGQAGRTGRCSGHRHQHQINGVAVALPYCCRIVLLICAVALLMILFVLLKPVHRELALLAAFFNLVSIGLEAAITMYLLEALFPLGNAGYLTAFAPEQLHAMASLSLKSHSYGSGVSLIFFGCFCLVIGYLIFKSEYLPKTVGVLMQIAGLSYLTNSFALVLAPAWANRLFPADVVPAFVGEASLCLWLLVKGVN